MKICIATKHKNWSCEHTGKGKFLTRLAKALRRQDCEIVSPDVEADINIAVGKNQWKPNAKKNILRLGPAHFEKEPNKRKHKAMKTADGVVYQSSFSKKFCHAFIGRPSCPERVIFNGADPKEFFTKTMSLSFKHNFLASTRVWTNQKRLRYIKRAFVEAEVKDSCLWICGDSEEKGDHYYRNTNQMVKYKGLVDEETLKLLYAHCDAMIHIVHLDACPNSVVECLVAGTPVICSNQGGTKELVGNYGIVLETDPVYDFKPVKRLPKGFNTAGLSAAIKHVANYGIDMDPPDYLHIDIVAKKYLEFFEEVLK